MPMNLSHLLAPMNQDGTLSDEQFKALSDLRLKRVFYLYLELRVAFYAGILSLTRRAGAEDKEVRLRVGNGHYCYRRSAAAAPRSVLIISE